MKLTLSEKISSGYNRVLRLCISRLSSKSRVKYLRKQGVKIGNNCRIDTVDFSTEPYLITIGNNVAISAGTWFITHDGAIRCFKPGLTGGVFGKIIIGNNVFVGNNCIILLNTNIGDNCIIGAGSVVRGNIPANSVVMGNPAKVIGNMSMIKFLYKNNPGLIQTDGLTMKEKDLLVKKALCKD